MDTARSGLRAEAARPAAPHTSVTVDAGMDALGLGVGFVGVAPPDRVFGSRAQRMASASSSASRSRKGLPCWTQA